MTIASTHRIAWRAAAAGAALALGACATPPAPVAQSPSNASTASASVAKSAAPAASSPEAKPAAAPAAAPRPGEPPPLRPFADVIKDAREIKGFFTFWQKEERTWLEVRPEQLDEPFFFSTWLASGLGERFFLPGLLGQEHVVTLRRAGNNLQLIAKNLRVRAPAGTPLAAAVQESYSDSLLASAAVVSAPHPERKSFLVDAAVLFGSDIPGAQTQLETRFRLGYAFDRNNSGIERVRSSDAATHVTYRAHYAVPKIPAPPLAPPPPGAPRVAPPTTLPDNRSLFLIYTYNLMPLPKEPMRPRRADQRVGHFTTAFLDLGNELGLDARTHYVERWRLEKKDPAAAVSEPKEPIVVWMDKNIPEKWRDAVRAGILEWNKAFERAGFKDAIVVKQQPAGADWSTVEGTRHIAVRWFAMQGPGAVAVGPSQSDPRTGEILAGAAIIPENWVRIGRAQAGETLPRPPAPSSLAEAIDGWQCAYAFDALEQANFAFDLLVARGALDPTGPDADRFIRDSLKDVVMHEVGHALGLRHNFKGSTGVQLDKLRDAAYARAHGISNSVMDYNALNIPLENEPATVYNQATLGAYDYWAIEYAYRPLPPETEHEELAKIAARSADDPALAYATDEDAGGFFGTGIDPTVNQFDLGSDPLAYYRRRVVLARELLARTQKFELKPGDNLSVYRRNLQRGIGAIGFVAPLVGKYVGGVYTSREVAGAGDAPLFVPVPAARQREALDLLAKEVFSVDSFRFDPKFMSRLGVDHLERFTPGGQVVVNTDFSLATAVLDIQKKALDQLMSDAVAVRLADAETKVADKRGLLSFADVQTQLADAIWGELRAGRDIDSLRRNLQREHARRLATALVRPTSAVAADVRGVQRAVALRLEAELRRQVGNARLNAATRAHIAEMQALLAEALKAPLVRQGV
ncbi:MAG: zinc-dependent metalloprotease [Burkholderiaceae bacterium]